MTDKPSDLTDGLTVTHRWLTIEQTAWVIGVSARTIGRRIENNEVESMLTDGDRRYVLVAVADFIDGRVLTDADPGRQPNGQFVADGKTGGQPDRQNLTDTPTDIPSDLADTAGRRTGSDRQRSTGDLVVENAVLLTDNLIGGPVSDDLARSIVALVDGVQRSANRAHRFARACLAAAAGAFIACAAGVSVTVGIVSAKLTRDRVELEAAREVLHGQQLADREGKRVLARTQAESRPTPLAELPPLPPPSTQAIPHRSFADRLAALAGYEPSR